MTQIMPKPKRTHHLRYGQGSFYWDANRRVWRGTIEAEPDADGRRRRFTVSSRDEDTAWARLRQKARDVEAGRTTLDISDRVTVREWAEQWLDERRHQVRPKTYATDHGQVTKWILPRFGRVQLRDLAPAHMRSLAKAMRQAGVSTTTIRYTQRLFQQMCRDAKREGYMVPDTFLLAQKATTAVSDRTAIPVEDAIALVKTAAGMEYGTRWVAALLQGMRQGECLGLTWDAVDLDSGELTISWQLQELPYEDREQGVFSVPDGYEARQLQGRFHLVRPKTRAGYRVIPLVPHMAAALAEWQRRAPVSPYGLVWANPDGSLRTPTQDRGEWQTLQRLAGVAKPDGSLYVLHEARHTTATLLLAAGVDPEIIKAILGHSSIVTSRGYMTVRADMKRAALEAVGELLHIES